MEADNAVSPMTRHRRYQIAVEDLALGMYVVELDRPWLDTPFLLQGFLADSQIELDTLRSCCSHVFVDLEQSAPELAEVIRRAEARTHSPEAGRPPTARASTPPPAPSGWDTPAAGAPIRSGVEAERRSATSGRSFRRRADVRISDDTRKRFRQFVRETAQVNVSDSPDLLERARGWLGGLLNRAPARHAVSDRDRLTRESLRPWLPADLKWVDYVDARPIEAELARARCAYSRAHTALAQWLAQARESRPASLEDLAAAVSGLVGSIIDQPDALLWVGRTRGDSDDGLGHSLNVALALMALGRQLGLPLRNLHELGLVGLLADVGKIRVPRALLQKPGMLTSSEFDLVKEHVKHGLALIREAGGLPTEVEQGIAQHHERLDGSGYPEGIQGEALSLYGRMAAIADSYTALITPRAYARPLAPQNALMNLYEWADTSFDGPLVEQFVQAIGVFPVGTLVELSSGEVALVLAHHRTRRLEPRVRILTFADKAPLEDPVECDLARQTRSSLPRRKIVRGLVAGAYGFVPYDQDLQASFDPEA